MGVYVMDTAPAIKILSNRNACYITRMKTAVQCGKTGEQRLTVHDSDAYTTTRDAAANEP